MSKQDGVTTPLNPTKDFEEIINDKTGLTGITTNTNKKPEMKGEKAQVDESSDFRSKANEDIASASEKTTPDHTTHQPNMDPSLKDRNVPPHVAGEQSISGDMPDPSSDDDVLKSAQTMGIALEEDTEHPQELDLGGDIDKGEEYKRTH